MKRLFDFSVALFGLLLMSPLLLLFMLLIWLQDFHSPFYIAPRMRRKGLKFSMVKLRSMVVNADKIGGILPPAPTSGSPGWDARSDATNSMSFPSSGTC